MIILLHLLCCGALVWGVQGVATCNLAVAAQQNPNTVAYVSLLGQYQFMATSKSSYICSMLLLLVYPSTTPYTRVYHKRVYILHHCSTTINIRCAHNCDFPYSRMHHCSTISPHESSAAALQQLAPSYISTLFSSLFVTCSWVHQLLDAQ